MDCVNRGDIENAQITNVSLTMEDYCCLTFWLTLEGNGWGCGYGGYCIGKAYLSDRETSEFKAESGYGLEAMMRIMDTVGVTKWEDLKGKYVRVMKTDWGGTIKVIGNLIKDKWFDIGAFFAERFREVGNG